MSGGEPIAAAGVDAALTALAGTGSAAAAGAGAAGAAGAGAAAGGMASSPFLASPLNGSIMGAASPSIANSGAALGSGTHGLLSGAVPGELAAGSQSSLMKLGTGTFGIEMPTAAETAAPWYSGLGGRVSNGLDSYGKATVGMKAVGLDPFGTQQQMRPQAPRPIFSGEPSQISAPAQQIGSGGTNNYTRAMLMRRMGLLGG